MKVVRLEDEGYMKVNLPEESKEEEITVRKIIRELDNCTKNTRGGGERDDAYHTACSYYRIKLRHLEKRIEAMIDEKMRESETYGSIEYDEFQVVASWLGQVLGKEENNERWIKEKNKGNNY